MAQVMLLEHLLHTLGFKGGDKSEIKGTFKKQKSPHLLCSTYSFFELDVDPLSILFIAFLIISFALSSLFVSSSARILSSKIHNS